MPRRDDLKTIAIIGSGPIVIGQACEFDYSGVQALKVLREEGYRTVLDQLEPGHDHDRPGLGRRDLPRAARPRGRDRACCAASGPTRCCRRSAARRRSTWRWSSQQAGVLDELGIELIGASAQGDPHRRGPRGVRRRRWRRSACACRAR